MDHRLTFEDSVIVSAPPEALYDVVSDIGRTGEWSPVCTACWWDDPEQGAVEGAWFTGRNEQPGRTWETRSRVVVADRPRELAWVVGGSFVRWGYTFSPSADGTEMTESWEFLPDGISHFHLTYGDDADAQIDARVRSALDGIPATLAAIRRIAESTSA